MAASSTMARAAARSLTGHRGRTDPRSNSTKVEAIRSIMHFYAFRELLANSSEVTRMERNSILFLRNMPATGTRKFPATENHRTGTIP